MDILFLIPPKQLNSKKMPVDRVYGCNYGFDYKPSIHLIQLATLAKEANYKTRFLDCPAEGYNLKDFTAFIKKNLSIKIVVFFSVWLSLKEDLLAAEIISNRIKDVKIIFSGAYPTWKPELFLKKKNYFVIRGEPERPFSRLTETIIEGKSGYFNLNNLSFLKKNKVISNPCGKLINLDKLCSPDYQLIKGKYFFNRLSQGPATILSASRGCKYGCSYCAPQAIDQAIELEYKKSNPEKPPLRLKSARKVIEEFKQIASLGYQAVEICDNQFIWDKERTIAICEAIKKLNLKWICCARADYLKDKQILALMREAGCSLIYIGTESFNQSILNDIKKGLNLADIYKAIKLVKDCKIEAEISLLLGCSQLETKETISENIKKVKKNKSFFVHYAIASPLPNTFLYQTAKKNGWLKYKDFIPSDNLRQAQLNLPNISAKELKKIVKMNYLRQYLSARFILKELAKINSLAQFNFRVKSLLRFLKYLINR
ncbi:MAG: B12-binding domain-containing radical SAM protein [Candidatus Omnitrophica bacterium]|nr:B12-binding domain-containing radical SAM protein [Candidatus Omnitrophota bacterium]MCF7891442.1 B12-binding domain-containing radical SAM protein [Candidatus Omnitrophota bacterium]MCF7895378.1 B12-binding domain-containing radical SAM protein [Candidatus Omnitrophota bacterium]MCF7897186.1 B12-binding domain-containing radical SAM protein [Candidatus Omnitrophota bacterium]MCF7908915.1 B12-binding domain-containing radical SAM protein [Candidatus Omnitrophota bacterium]